MRILISKVLGFSYLAFVGCQASPINQMTSCQPLGFDEAALRDFKTNTFEIADERRADMALALIDCLGDPDPTIRDGIAYEAITSWLRSGTMLEANVRTLKDNLLTQLKTGDENGFATPFAALVLSEVARVDRVTPYLEGEERTAFVIEATEHMRQIADYRGFDDTEGWRHDVAHTADWLMQLSLNENVNRDDLFKIQNAVATQVAPISGHAYIHGESARLARPILFMAMRGEFSEADWTAWLTKLAEPEPLENWNAAFKSESGLARLHNTKAFLNSLYVNASASQIENVKQLLPGTLSALRELP